MPAHAQQLYQPSEMSPPSYCTRSTMCRSRSSPISGDAATRPSARRRRSRVCFGSQISFLVLYGRHKARRKARKAFGRTSEEELHNLLRAALAPDKLASGEEEAAYAKPVSVTPLFYSFAYLFVFFLFFSSFFRCAPNKQSLKCRFDSCALL